MGCQYAHIPAQARIQRSQIIGKRPTGLARRKVHHGSTEDTELNFNAGEAGNSFHFSVISVTSLVNS